MTAVPTATSARGRWRARPWVAVVVGSAVAAVSMRSRSRSPLAAAVVVLVGQAAAFAAARGALRHVTDVQARRRAHERARSRAYRDLLVDMATHGPLGVARDQLRGVELADLRPRAAVAVAAALRSFEEIEAELAVTASLRAELDAVRDRGLGGFAPNAPSRRGKPLALYGVRPDLPPYVPVEVGVAIQQVGAVMDEVRLLHTAEIEWSALLFTLWSRAALLGLAPRLPTLTAAPVRVRCGSAGVDPTWTLATAFALATASAAPAVATAVMDRGPSGRRVRRQLLLAEVPLACGLAYRHPSWLACTYATGWTNWWQRPDFNWPRLGVFIATLSALQAAGLRRRGVPVARSAGEIVSTLAAIFYTGGSYGAMLPLSASVAAEVVVTGGLRDARAARAARRRMQAAAATLREAGEALGDAAAASSGTAIVAQTVIEAAAKLERSAAAIDEPPDVLGELVATAHRRSDVPVRDSADAVRRRAEAERVGLDPPAELRTPTYKQGEALRTARVREARDARVLHDIVAVLIQEAEVHGTGPVHVTWELAGGRLVLRVANRVRSMPRAGLRGSGAARLARLAGRLPGPGTVDTRDKVDGSFVGMQPRPGWFGVQVSCSASVLADSLGNGGGDGH